MNCIGRLGRPFLRSRHLCLPAALLAIPVYLLLLWLCGLSDIFFEIPFSKFQWPPYVDVQRQTVLELLGQSTENPPINKWSQFRPLINPNCQHNRLTRKRSILAIVKSAPERIERREAIRATFGSIQAENFTDSFRFRTVFVMGKPANVEEKINFQEMDSLEREAHTFGDLLVGTFTDHYFNNTLKFVHSIGLANDYCGVEPVSYVILLDDDYLMLPWNLAAEAAKHVPNDRLYMGWRFDTTPFRNRFHKFRMSLAEYPFDAYPSYITAGAVLLTAQTVREFHAAIQHTALFRLDDIYTGILAHLLAIQPQHNPNFVMAHHQSLGPDWWQTLVAAHGYSAQQLRLTFAQAVEEKRRKEGKTVRQI